MNINNERAINSARNNQRPSIFILTLSTFNPLLNNNGIIILLLLNGFIHLYKSIKILLIGD